jgi:hypothetical protein|tara:strand:+ start:1072 stop:1425 length:354 start_codon:yes stop_codon:yes gene_type:complete
MRAYEAAEACLQQMRATGGSATKNATASLLGSDRPATWQATSADKELALLNGLDGSKKQFLGAVDLVAHFDKRPWTHQEALEAVAFAWNCDLAKFTPLMWILSAAYADRIRTIGELE